MTLTRSATALAFGIGLTFAAGPLALAAGAGCPQRSDQEQYRNPPFSAEKAGQQQVGQNTSEAQKTAGSSGPGPLQYRQRTATTDSTTAQKTAHEQSGTQVASDCR